jgi:hypothetical protein
MEMLVKIVNSVQTLRENHNRRGHYIFFSHKADHDTVSFDIIQDRRLYESYQCCVRLDLSIRHLYFFQAIQLLLDFRLYCHENRECCKY